MFYTLTLELNEKILESVMSEYEEEMLDAEWLEYDDEDFEDDAVEM
jgi:hypothetical protein